MLRLMSTVKKVQHGLVGCAMSLKSRRDVGYEKFEKRDAG